jgi:hypothetical protein
MTLATLLNVLVIMAVVSILIRYTITLLLEMEKSRFIGWLCKTLPIQTKRFHQYLKALYNDHNSYRSPSKKVTLKDKPNKVDAWIQILFFVSVSTIMIIYGSVAIIDAIISFTLTWKMLAESIFFLICSFIGGWYIAISYKTAKINGINLQPWKRTIISSKN